MPCDDCSRAETCPPCVNEQCSHESWEEAGTWRKCADCSHGWDGTPDSASSSPDDLCVCGHVRIEHFGDFLACRDCPRGCNRFVRSVAGTETGCWHENAYQITGDKLRRPGRRLGYLCEPCGEVWMVTAPKAEPAGCIRPGGCRDIFHGCAHGCDAAADELSQQTQDMEPEAPEKDEYPWCSFCENWHAHGDRCVQPPEAPECGVERGCVYDRSTCAVQCKGVLDAVKRAVQAPSLRRPPYAVAYAIEGGAQYEIALPGDASVRAVDGALQITHDSAVLALSHVRPMES